MTDCYIRSIMCIATRHITDEELFLNYRYDTHTAHDTHDTTHQRTPLNSHFTRHRYNPINPYPNWYVQPDVEEAERRWKKPKALANPFW